MSACDPTVRYSRDTSDDWLHAVDAIVAAHPWSTDAAVWSVTFDCPHCCHSITKTLSRTHTLNLVEQRMEIRCQCEEEHEGRDDNVKGCGYGGHFDMPPVLAVHEPQEAPDA